MADSPLFTPEDVETCKAIANTIRYGTWGFSGEPGASAAYLEELSRRLQCSLVSENRLRMTTVIRVRHDGSIGFGGFLPRSQDE